MATYSTKISYNRFVDRQARSQTTNDVYAHIPQGQAGGRAAAGKLKRGIITHLDSLADDLPTSSTTTGRSQVWVSIYCNISGLVDVLVGQGICTPDTFQSFCVGFNQASPLFSIVDAGSGKEAADTKIKGMLVALCGFMNMRLIIDSASV